MNREYPYEDETKITAQDTVLFYAVGSNQINAHGTQHKLFVSKSTLIYSTADTTVQFNSPKNVLNIIVAGVWYEYKSNIASVYFPLPTGEDYLLFYFEGVLPEEARAPE
jgi:hypothetical protein